MFSSNVLNKCVLIFESTHRFVKEPQEMILPKSKNKLLQTLKIHFHTETIKIFHWQNSTVLGSSQIFSILKALLDKCHFANYQINFSLLSTHLRINSTYIKTVCTGIVYWLLELTLAPTNNISSSALWVLKIKRSNEKSWSSAFFEHFRNHVTDNNFWNVW